MTYSKIPIHPKTGAEPFTLHNESLGFSVIDFWSWSASDLIANTARGVVAEFIISKARDIDQSSTRDGWAAWDLTTPEGTKVEVKSAAYIQSRP